MIENGTMSRSCLRPTLQKFAKRILKPPVTFTPPSSLQRKKAATAMVRTPGRSPKSASPEEPASDEPEPRPLWTLNPTTRTAKKRPCKTTWLPIRFTRNSKRLLKQRARDASQTASSLTSRLHAIAEAKRNSPNHRPRKSLMRPSWPWTEPASTPTKQPASSPPNPSANPVRK